MKIRPVGAELYRADGRKDGYDEAQNHFLQICERARNEVNTQMFATERHKNKCKCIAGRSGSFISYMPLCR